MMHLTAQMIADHLLVRTSPDTFNPDTARIVPKRLEELERIISAQELLALNGRRATPKGNDLN